MRARVCAAAAAAVDRRRGDLHQSPAGDERHEDVRPLLHLRVSLGMREHRYEAEHTQPQQLLAERRGPPAVWRLDEQVVGVPGEAEAHELLTWTVELPVVELAAADEPHDA